MKPKPVEIKELEEVCLAHLKKAEELLVRVENMMVDLHCCKPGDKSEIRVRFEEYEANIEQAWARACKSYGVKTGYVLDLPLNVYKEVCEDYITKPGVELMHWLIGKSADCNVGKLPPSENPYVLAVAALSLSYNIGGIDGV